MYSSCETYDPCTTCTNNCCCSTQLTTSQPPTCEFDQAHREWLPVAPTTEYSSAAAGQEFANNARLYGNARPTGQCRTAQPDSSKLDHLLDEKLRPKNVPKQPIRPKAPPMPSFDNPPTTHRTCCPGKNYVPRPSFNSTQQNPYNQRYGVPNLSANMNPFYQSPSQRLQNVDVHEELRYFTKAENDEEDDDNGIEGFDCYRICEDCCEIELVCCAKDKDEKEKDCDEPKYQPAKYTRKQRFNFKDQGGSKNCCNTPAPKWPFPKRRNNTSNNKGCCSCCSEKKKTDKKKKKKKPEKEKQNCEDILPEKSGFYEFTKTDNKFFYFPEDRMKPKQPQIIIQQPPPMPMPAPPPPPVEDIQIIRELEDDDSDDCCDPYLQPIIQPIMMAPNMYNPMNPMNPYCNPCCNPNPCCNTNKNCCCCSNNNNNQQNSNRNNSQIPGYGNGISVSGKEYSTGNPVIPMCIPMMPPQPRKCYRRPPPRPCYPRPYGYPPPQGGNPNQFGRFPPPPMMGNRPPFPFPPPPRQQPPPPPQKKPAEKEKSSKESRPRHNRRHTKEKKDSNDYEYGSGTKTQTLTEASTVKPLSLRTPTTKSSEDSDRSTLSDITKSSFNSDIIVVPGIPGSALPSNIDEPPGLSTIAPSNVIVASGNDLTKQYQEVNQDGYVVTTVDLAPGRGDDIKLIATDQPAGGSPKVNITALTATTEVADPSGSPKLAPEGSLTKTASDAGKGDIAQFLGLGSPRSSRGRNSRSSKAGTPSEVRALKEELNKYLPKGSIGSPSQRKSDATENKKSSIGSQSQRKSDATDENKPKGSIGSQGQRKSDATEDKTDKKLSGASSITKKAEEEMPTENTETTEKPLESGDVATEAAEGETEEQQPT